MTGLSVDFDLAVSLGELKTEMRRHRKALEGLEQRTPFDAKVTASGNSPASGNFFLDLGSPQPGYYWIVRRVVIGGDTWSSSVSGSAELVISAGAFSGLGTGGSRTIPDTIDQYASLPVARFYSSHQVIVREQEHLVLVFVSPSAATLYSANAGIEVFRTLPTHRNVEA